MCNDVIWYLNLISCAINLDNYIYFGILILFFWTNVNYIFIYIFDVLIYSYLNFKITKFKFIIPIQAKIILVQFVWVSKSNIIN